MFKVSIVFLLAILCNGCASSTANGSAVSKMSTPNNKMSTSKNSIDKRLKKYASTQGCTMMKSGYMVCPKSMNR